MEFLDKLLEVYHLTKDEFDHMTRPLTLDDVEDYHNFDNIDKAKERILKAIENKEKILIYGDYDCDGITSISIMMKTFKMLNYDNAFYFVPSRYKDGYGINLENTKKIIDAGYQLIITVDNGVSQLEALEYAFNNNVDVILTDHHEMMNELPPNYTILHPFLKNKEKMAQCGAYVAFNLSEALLGRVDEYLLCLAGLGTISDMMPLVGPNRDIVRLTLQILNEKQYPQFTLLTVLSEIDEKTLGFDIAPKINAIGRIYEDYSIRKLIEYFINDDLKILENIASFIIRSNELRKEISKEVATKIDNKELEQNVIIYKFDDVKEGLIGLIAAKMINTYKKPCVIFTKTSEGLLKGSARSLDGFDIAENFKKVEHLLEAYGGHAKAGGLSLKEEKYDEFKKEFNSLCNPSVLRPEQKLIIEMDKDEFNHHNYYLIKKLSPYGEGFKEASLQTEFKLDKIKFVGKVKKFPKGDINEETSFIYFDELFIDPRNRIVKLIGKLEEVEYNNKKSLQLRVDEII